MTGFCCRLSLASAPEFAHWLDACGGFKDALRRRSGAHALETRQLEAAPVVNPDPNARANAGCTDTRLEVSFAFGEPSSRRDAVAPDDVLVSSELGQYESLDDFHRQLTEAGVVDTVKRLQGPFAFIFYQASTNSLWFARDSFGRRSLVLCSPAASDQTFDATLIVSSVTVQDPLFSECAEVPAGVIFRLDLASLSIDRTALQMRPDDRDDADQHVSRLLLRRGFRLTQPTVLDTWNHLYKVEGAVPAEGQLMDVSDTADPQQIIEAYLRLYDSEVNAFLQALGRSVTKSLAAGHGRQSPRDEDEPEPVAVLFSGGVDSLLLTAVLGQLLPAQTPIDLINVAFLGRNGHSAATPAPDRSTGENAVKKLRALFPARTWNFVKVDVDVAELKRQRVAQIRHVLKPAASVLDDSVGCATWFAARGAGRLDDGRRFESSARRLYLGSGSDELLAGYLRHRTVFQLGGWSALALQLTAELSRMWHRNCGRDDRVVSDHGRLGCLPFLDDEFVVTVNRLPMWLKADLRHRRGVGEKIVLRAALWKLGFGRLAFSHKRAIQFGSRIAKLENRAEKASDLCVRLR